jgi:hypothetical protein
MLSLANSNELFRQIPRLRWQPKLLSNDYSVARANDPSELAAGKRDIELCVVPPTSPRHG